MHKLHFLLVAPFPGVFIRRSAAYWVLLHVTRDVMMLFGARMDELRPADLLPGSNPLVPAVTLIPGDGPSRRAMLVTGRCRRLCVRERCDDRDAHMTVRQRLQLH